jgi:hypothetical protein
MLRTFELAALPPTLQLCLLSADRCQGLVQTAPAGRYGPRRFHAQELDAAFAPADVEELKNLGIVQPTDAAIELLITGYAQIEVAL